MLLYIWASKLSHFSGCNLRMKPLQQYYPDSNKNPDSDAWLHRTSASYACYTQRINCKLFAKSYTPNQSFPALPWLPLQLHSTGFFCQTEIQQCCPMLAGYAAASLLTRFFPCCKLTESKLQIELQ